MRNMNKTGYDEPLITDLTKDNVNNTIRKLTENVNRLLAIVRDLEKRVKKLES